MDNNVIELFGNNPKIVIEDEDPVIEFIQDYLLPWAMEQGLDVESGKFRLHGATIMTCLQGMLLDDI